MIKHQDEKIKLQLLTELLCAYSPFSSFLALGFDRILSNLKVVVCCQTT